MYRGNQLVAIYIYRYIIITLLGTSCNDLQYTYKYRIWILFKAAWHIRRFIKGNRGVTVILKIVCTLLVGQEGEQGGRKRRGRRRARSKKESKEEGKRRARRRARRSNVLEQIEHQKKWLVSPDWNFTDKIALTKKYIQGTNNNDPFISFHIPSPNPFISLPQY
jgi:hypothetical protein